MVFPPKGGDKHFFIDLLVFDRVVEISSTDAPGKLFVENQHLIEIAAAFRKHPLHV